MSLSQIPKFLGGQSNSTFESNTGPWNDFEIVDVDQAGQGKVGLRRRDDPSRKVWTAEDIMKFENPIVKNGGVMGTSGAVMYGPDRKTIVPFDPMQY